MSKVVTLAEQIAEEVNRNFNGDINKWANHVESLLVTPSAVWIGELDTDTKESDVQSTSGTGSSHEFNTDTREAGCTNSEATE